MDQQFCPGAKLLRQPKPEIFTCPRCGEEVEIWTDERKGKCLHCGKIVLREEHGSCLDWCEFGKECVGEETYNRYITRKAESLKEKLFDELGRIIEERGEGGNTIEEGFVRDDPRAVSMQKTYARRLVEYTERLAKREDADLYIVVPAAILSTIANGPFNDDTCDLTKLLLKQGLQVDLIKKIIDVIRLINEEKERKSNDHPEIENENRTKNVAVVRDAYRLTALEQKAENGETDPEVLKRMADDHADDEKVGNDMRGTTAGKVDSLKNSPFYTETAAELAEDIVVEIMNKKSLK